MARAGSGCNSEFVNSMQTLSMDRSSLDSPANNASVPGGSTKPIAQALKHMNQDLEHLRLLSVFHYVVGGMTALCSLLPLVHVGLGLFFILAPTAFGPNPTQQPPPFIGWLFLIIGGAAIVMGMTLAALIITTGRFLGHRRHYTFCLVIACIECLMMPFGTVLGICAIIVLARESVKQLFAQVSPGVPP